MGLGLAYRKAKRERLLSHELADAAIRATALD